MKDKTQLKSSAAVLEYQRDYYLEHSEQITKRATDWQRANKEAHNTAVARYYQKNKELAAAASIRYRERNKQTDNWIRRGMVNRSRKRAQKLGLDHNITLEHVNSIWPADNRCPVLGCEFSKDQQNISRCASLDRIDNTLGYVIGNVAVISWRANSLKSDSSVAELEAILTYMKAALITSSHASV